MSTQSQFEQAKLAGEARPVGSKRDDVRSKSGQPVDHSGPGLTVGQTLSPTAGRKPEACSRVFAVRASGAACQPKSGRGAERSSAESCQRAALASSSEGASREAGALNPGEELDQESIRLLISVFQLLDEWDQEGVKR